MSSVDLLKVNPRTDPRRRYHTQRILALLSFHAFPFAVLRYHVPPERMVSTHQDNGILVLREHR